MSRNDDIGELITRFDVTDPAFVADPYPVLGALREATPLFHDPRTDQWMVTRFDDVAATLRDRRVGRVYTHRYTHDDFERPAPDPRWASFEQHERWSLLNLEPPDHTRLRRLVQKAFSPSAVRELEGRVRAFSEGLLDHCVDLDADTGSFDLISDYAQPYSVAVICSMLGVPVDDADRLLAWSHAIVKMYELAGDDEVWSAADRAAAEYIDYTRDLIAEKRRSPDGLLLSRLLEVDDDGDTLSDDEIVSTAMVLVEAGHEATVNTLGNGVRAALEHPDQWRRLVDGDVASSDAVEELVRYDAPLQLFERWVLDEGVEIGGTPIEVGQQVALLFGSAQRDPRRFDEPDRFDIGRAEAGHVGFGGGIHFCVGAPLARLELAVSLDGIVRRFPDLEVVTEPEYHPTFVIRGLTALRLSAR